MYVHFYGGKKQHIGKLIKQSVVKGARTVWAEGQTNNCVHLVSCCIIPNDVLKK